MEEKNSFVFYRSFYEAIRKVSSKEKKVELFELICRLPLKGCKEKEMLKAIRGKDYEKR